MLFKKRETKNYIFKNILCIYVVQEIKLYILGVNAIKELMTALPEYDHILHLF